MESDAPPQPAAVPAAPTVSVVMPVRNEARDLPRAVEAILSQRYAGDVEVVLSVAPSDDGTESLAAELATRDRRIVVVDNPEGTTPSGLNRAIGVACGDIVARVDAHAELAEGYLSTAVARLGETGAWNVGGVQRAVGRTPLQRAVAAAMSSRFGTGDARFHYGGEAGPSDTVYLGVWPRSVLERLGGFDESLLRNQDYELNVRIRAAGGIVWFDPGLEVIYRPRATLGALARQYLEYGRWKRAVLRRHPGSLRWRQTVPPLALVANAGGLLGGFVVSPWLFAVPGTYVAGVLVATAIVGRGDGELLLRLPAVFATMHHAWGAGFLVGPPRG